MPGSRRTLSTGPARPTPNPTAPLRCHLPFHGDGGPRMAARRGSKLKEAGGCRPQAAARCGSTHRGYTSVVPGAMTSEPQRSAILDTGGH
jgi:hypothetical protein